MKTFLLLSILIFLCGFIPKESRVMPVQNATVRDWNTNSFWFYPWGRSGVHKGIDIFATHGTPVRATTSGIVLYSGQYGLGGNVVYMLGANWRFHYYAHLDSTKVSALTPVAAGEMIGTVGTSGNAQGKPPHLHYTIKSAFPRFWAYDKQYYSSWNRMYYLDPGKFLQGKPQ